MLYARRVLRTLIDPGAPDTQHPISVPQSRHLTPDIRHPISDTRHLKQDLRCKLNLSRAAGVAGGKARSAD